MIEMFKPYAVCEDGCIVAEYATILQAATHADGLKASEPDAVVTILVSLRPSDEQDETDIDWRTHAEVEADAHARMGDLER